MKRSGVNESWKSRLEPPPFDATHSKLQPMRLRRKSYFGASSRVTMRTTSAVSMRPRGPSL